MKRHAPTAVLVLACVLPAAAGAHVELKPGKASAGSEKRLALVVENERHDANTERLDVQLPAGVSVAPARPSGWTARVRGRRLVFAASRDSAKIAGDHVEKRFRLTATLPDRPRSTLVFKVLQTYDSGEVVRWIGSAGSEEPAARLRLTAAERAPQGTEEPSGGATAPSTTPAAEDGGDDDGGNGLVIGLLIAAAVAVVGAMLWLRSRRRRV